MRGRLIFAFLAEIYRLRAETAPPHAPSMDPDFLEPVPQDDAGSDPFARPELPPVRLPCQVEPQRVERLRHHAGANAPASTVVLILHFKDLERQGLVSPTGQALLQPSDRLGALYDRHGTLVQTIRTPPGLYLTEARPLGFGLGRGRARRNLLHLTFEARSLAPRRVS